MPNKYGNPAGQGREYRKVKKTAKKKTYRKVKGTPGMASPYGPRRNKTNKRPRRR